MPIRLPPRPAAARPARLSPRKATPAASMLTGDRAAATAPMQPAPAVPTLATHPHPDVPPDEAAIRAFAARSHNLIPALARLRAPQKSSGPAAKAALAAFINDEEAATPRR